MSNIATLRAGNSISPIVPTSIEEVMRLASGIKASGLSTQGMDTEEKIIVAILHGLEIGLPPMQAIQRIAVINGRPTIWGDALPALLWSRGFKIEEEIADDGARCTIVRPDGTRITRAFTQQDAIKAGLWGKGGPWKAYPQRMLQMRARGFAARDGAADVLAGLYLAEEMQDAEMKDVTPRKELAELPDDIPDVSDIPDAVDEMPPEDDAIADPASFVEHYRDEFSALRDAERQEFVEGNASVVQRLPEHHRREIANIISEAAE